MHKSVCQMQVDLLIIIFKKYFLLLFNNTPILFKINKNVVLWLISNCVVFFNNVINQFWLAVLTRHLPHQNSPWLKKAEFFPLCNSLDLSIFHAWKSSYCTLRLCFSTQSFSCVIVCRLLHYVHKPYVDNRHKKNNDPHVKSYWFRGRFKHCSS